VISEIRMDSVASFKSPQSLTTDKKINLIYGLNGTGKSTISNFLRAADDPKYTACKLIPSTQAGLCVYNQSFIRETFFESTGLPGIFSLSKENKQAAEQIEVANRRIVELRVERDTKMAQLQTAEAEFANARRAAVEQTWRIKTEFTGGDRVLDYCLTGLMGQKEKLFSHLLGIPKPKTEPASAIPELKRRVEALGDGSSPPENEIAPLSFACHAIEGNSIFAKSIGGSKDSSVATLIEQLRNSDWVAKGLDYLPVHVDADGHPCPFCQERTITSELIAKLQAYFDASYQADISKLQHLRREYAAGVKTIPSVKGFASSPFALDSIEELEKRHARFVQAVEDNLRSIQSKVGSPREQCIVNDSTALVSAFNEELAKVNRRISSHNSGLANRAKALADLKSRFWQIMRWKYDQTLDRYGLDLTQWEKRKALLEADVEAVDSAIAAERRKISAAQRQTVNVDQAIENINARLLDVGIEDFRISKHLDSLYRLERPGSTNNEFESLNEGEKMIISFLYFCELCLGRKSAEDTATSRVVVIDDPISSLSHVHVFSVGQFIKRLFFRSPTFEQVFVFTHSLYFFYELTDTDHERRHRDQKLFRIVKNLAGSRIVELKYEEIKNDYESYWDVVRDPQQSPALIANCMRNIIEYFFDLVKRKDSNKLFMMASLQGVRHQAFCRYVNRESHSIAQNVFDLKEFDYAAFCEGLRLVFEGTGYAEHYQEMMKG
jgi:wobble nucleotide-excising tRNase